MGCNSGRSRLHSADVWFPGSFPEIRGAERSRIRAEHSNDRISTRDGRTASSAIRNLERCRILFLQCSALADVQRWRNEALETADFDHWQRANRASVLPCIPAERERRASHPLAESASDSVVIRISISNCRAECGFQFRTFMVV